MPRCNCRVDYNRDKWEIYFKKKIKEVKDHNEMQLGSIPKIKMELDNYACN